MTASSTKYLLFLAILTAVGLLVLPSFFSKRKNAKPALPEVVDFNFHIKPIISDRCFKCHGPDEAKQEAELGLHQKEDFFKASRDAPGMKIIASGNLEKSELFRRITSTDPNEMMPPPESNLSLTQWEISLIKKWIEQGAEHKSHWAFEVPRKVDLPKVKNGDWPRNEIDFFTLKKMEENGLRPNDEASRGRLLRRASYTLTGLPPTPEMLDRFFADDSVNAFEKMVDELLASPAFGEHMAAHWLDVARYGDSHGYQDDSYRSQWPWRDWVIHAFNTNLPYDDFATWQLAGDLLPDATKEHILATGFCRNHKITQEGGVIEEEYRVEYIADETNTFGTAMLGLTFECARCHDHKYDPISQEEYFKTYAFFNQSNERGFYGDVSNVSIAELPVLSPTKEDLAGILHFVNANEADTVVSMVMQEVDTPRATFVLKRGQYDMPEEEVDFGTPDAVLEFPADLPRNRLGLSKWAFDEANPLTSRVAANRIWQQVFGTGIVKTSDNFGSQGELPSHPELLDWLAVDFRENGWDMKRLLRQMLCSSTFRQSAVISSEKLDADPDNRLLSRAPRLRLTAEMVRDSWLASSGQLVETIGGPPVRPYQPPGLWAETTPGEGRGSLTKYVPDTGEKLYRRSLYTIWKRTMPPPMMINFDGSYRDVCKLKRQSTNTPLQALNLMNDPQMLEASRFFAEQLLLEHDLKNEQRIEKAFRHIVGRLPSANESDVLGNHFEERKNSLTDDVAKQLLKSMGASGKLDIDVTDCAALTETIQMMFNLDETIHY